MRAQANLMSKVLRFWGLFRVEDIPYLRVHVVVVNDWKDDNLFIPLILPLAESRVWWRREMGIEVDFQLQGEVIEDLQQDQAINDPEQFGAALRNATKWQVRNPVPIIFIFPKHAHLTNKRWYGAAWEWWGFGAVAGQTKTLINEIIDHELGHILGLDHEGGTFMQEEFDHQIRHVLPAQRTKLRNTVANETWVR